MQLTARQLEVLHFLRQFQVRYGYMPTRIEIADGLGFKSENAAHDHITALQKKGMVTVQPGTARSLRLTDTALQLLGGSSPPSPEQMVALPVVDMARVNRRPVVP